MEIARSSPLSIRFPFDPKSLLRQIAEGVAQLFRAASDHDPARMALVASVRAYEPRLARAARPLRAHSGRRQGAYAPRWG
jgi:hypothetical protein